MGAQPAPTRVNWHEERARALKVAKLAAMLPPGQTAQEIARTADFFAKLSQADRARFAAAAGVKPPSDVTWSALVELLRSRRTRRQTWDQWRRPAGREPIR